MEIVSVADLKVGMFLAEPDCPWTELPFALQGFVVATPKQIDILREKCRYVYIDRSRSRGEHYADKRRDADSPRQWRAPEADVGKAEAGPGSPPEREAIDDRRQRRRRLLSFLEHQDESEEARELANELVAIEPRFSELQTALQTTFSLLAAEKPVDLDCMRDGLHDMSASLGRNPDALMWLMRLRQVDQYSFDHALDVSVYMLLFGIHLGWRGEQLVELGLAGLLQDVGKIQLPEYLLTKREALTDEEHAIMQSHVASSLEILYAQENMPPGVMMTVSRHHERWDGSGYPRGRRFDQIGLPGEMAGLTDSFCAMQRNKPYRDALGHQQALEELYMLRDKAFNPALMEQFVQCVGLYPIGTLVELDSGEVGVVIQQNRIKRSRPRILLVLDAGKERINGYQVIDLRHPAHASRRIARPLPRQAYGLAADDYYL